MICQKIRETRNETRNEIVSQLNECENDYEKWLMDSGSTVHVTYDDTYMFNKRKINSTITVGTGNKIKATSKGSLLLRQVNSNKTLLLSNILYVPSFNQNIISVTSLLQKGYKTYGDKNMMTLMFKERKIHIKNTDKQNMYYYVCARREFKDKDRERIEYMNDKDGVQKKGVQTVYEIKDNKEKRKRQNKDSREKEYEKSIRRNDAVKEIEINRNDQRKQQKKENIQQKRKDKRNKNKEKRTKMNINVAHDAFGHMDEVILREYCKRHNIELTGNMKTCVGCMIAKAQRKPVKKQTSTRATSAGERIYIDTSGPYPRSLRGKKYWFKIVDDYSRKNWNYFMKKNEEVRPANFITRPNHEL